MSQDLVDVFVLSLVAMLNPTLLAAVTVLLLLPNPRRLMLGYVLGAYTTSITVGLVIAFTLQGSSFEGTSRHTIGPGQDIAIGVIMLVVAWVLRGGHDERLRERRRRHKDAKQGDADPKEPWVQRLLGRGSPRITYVVGILLSFPGVSYLAALSHIGALDPGTVPTILLVISFCVVQLLLIEVPLLGYAFAPERTRNAVASFRAWLAQNGRRVAIIGAAVLGILLIVRGVVTLA
jgi:hypothetical protein